jgi:hypothetical protein
MESELTMTETTTQNSPATTPKRNKRDEMARRGLWLPTKLQKVGIRVEAGVSIEYQELARRYVLRGKESGGATSELGCYCSFVSSDGQPLGWTQKIDTIAVNMVHAVVIAPALVRVEVLRVEHTYDLLITRHSLESAEEQGRKPRLVDEIVFHGRLGQLTLDLWSRDKQFRGSICPAFFTRSGETLTPPEGFEDSVKHAVAGACCIGCRRHTHVLVAPRRPVQSEILGDAKSSPASAV